MRTPKQIKSSNKVIGNYLLNVRHENGNELIMHAYFTRDLRADNHEDIKYVEGVNHHVDNPHFLFIQENSLSYEDYIGD